MLARSLSKMYLSNTNYFIFPLDVTFFLSPWMFLKIEIWELGQTTVCGHYPVFRLQICISG